jgi:hypothetical protein
MLKHEIPARIFSVLLMKALQHNFGTSSMLALDLLPSMRPLPKLSPALESIYVQLTFDTIGPSARTSMVPSLLQFCQRCVFLLPAHPNANK